MSKRVTFTGDREGSTVTPRTLIAALEKALAWLRGRDEDEILDWEVVRVALGKRVQMTFQSESANGPLSARMNRLHVLQGKRLPQSLPRMTDDDISSTMDLASMIGEGKGFNSFSISSAEEPIVRLTPALVERVEQLAKKTKRGYREWTTVRGTLYQITAVPDGTHIFKILRMGTGEKIACSFPSDRNAEVADALERRVEVRGQAECTGLGEVKSIEVADLKDFRVLEDNPVRFSDMPGVNITGGVGAFEHIRRVRGGY